ncbi:hypothetical protein KM043_014220 [Ampulex compressa]|nr:hypothetical protein KM043_014220 [Ampulex compressa]
MNSARCSSIDDPGRGYILCDTQRREVVIEGWNRLREKGRWADRLVKRVEERTLKWSGTPCGGSSISTPGRSMSRIPGKELSPGQSLMYRLASADREISFMKPRRLL